jgi:chromosome segregation ATPase
MNKELINEIARMSGIKICEAKAVNAKTIGSFIAEIANEAKLLRKRYQDYKAEMEAIPGEARSLQHELESLNKRYKDDKEISASVMKAIDKISDELDDLANEF